LNYIYDDLSAPSQPAAPQVSRLARLGAAPAPDEEGFVMAPGKTLELVGASAATLPVVGTVARASVQLDVGVRRKVSASLAAASASAPPDRLYLHLENVRGAQDAHVLNVYINLPAGERPGDHPELLAGSIGLFGLRRASMPGGPHAGGGLSFTLDITDIVDALHLNNALDVDTLQVSIVPDKAVPDYAQITIGRISIYRKGN
jgi:tyrosinase